MLFDNVRVVFSGARQPYWDDDCFNMSAAGAAWTVEKRNVTCTNDHEDDDDNGRGRGDDDDDDDDAGPQRLGQGRGGAAMLEHQHEGE